jgi:hypothetical protein
VAAVLLVMNIMVLLLLLLLLLLLPLILAAASCSPCSSRCSSRPAPLKKQHSVELRAGFAQPQGERLRAVCRRDDHRGLRNR